MSRVCYIRVWPRDPATGATVGLAMAGGGSHVPYLLGGVHYRAGIVREPRFKAALGFEQSGWTGGALPSVSDIQFAPADPALLRSYARLYWRGAAIEVDAGEEVTGVGRILTGTIADATIVNGALVMAAADFSAKLSTPAIQSWFQGTGGVEGDAVAENRVKRRSYGYVRNIEGRVFNAANNIYEFGDLARPALSCTALRDKGRDGPLAILGWQGSIAATLDALKASSPPQGGGVFAPSIACAKWWTQPSGPLTADIHGEGALLFGETAAQIAAALLTAASGPPIVNLFDATIMRPAVVGLHLGDDSETTTAALDRLLLPMSLLWRLGSTGQIDIRPWTWDGDAPALQGQFIGRQRTLAPMRTRRLGYQRNHRLHSEGEIAADILLSDATYADGTTIEQLKPAEAGANITGNHSAAAFAGQGSLATRNDVLFGSQITNLPDVIKPGNLVDGQYVRADLGRYLDGASIQTLRPAEGGANVTEGRVAASIAGQGSFATVNSVGYGSSLLTGFGVLASLGNLFFGSPYLLEGFGGAAATLGNFKTAFGIASGIAGQGAWATFGTTTGVVSRLQNDGYMQANSVYLPGVNFLNNVFPAEYGANATEGRTAAAIQGQSAWATYTKSVSEVVSPAGNLFPYPRPARDGRAPPSYGWLRFAGSGDVSGWSEVQAYDGNANGGGIYVVNRNGNFGSVTLIPFFDVQLRDAPTWIIGARKAGISLAGYTSNGNFNPLAEWINADRSLGLGQIALNYNSSSNRYEGVLPAAPTGAAYIRVYAGHSHFPAFNGYQDVCFWGIKVEPDAVTPYSDVSENKSLTVEWGNGLMLNTLRPAEFGSNVTENRSAAAIAGQSSWATYGGLNPNNVAGQVRNLQTDGNIQASTIYKPNVSWLNEVWPAESGANATEGRTAAAIAGQGPLATKDRVNLGDGGGLANQANSAWMTDAGVITGQGTAAGIAGQGALATAPQIGSWNVANYYHFSAFKLDYSITRSDGVTTVTESMALTMLGVSAGFSGQGALATRNDVNTGQVAAFTTYRSTFLQNADFVPTPPGGGGVAYLVNNIWYTACSGFFTKDVTDSELTITASGTIWSDNDLGAQMNIRIRTPNGAWMDLVPNTSYPSGYQNSVGWAYGELGAKQSDWCVLIVSDGNYDGITDVSRSVRVSYGALASGDYEVAFLAKKTTNGIAGNHLMLPGASIKIEEQKR